jgi:hypothetical protein
MRASPERYDREGYLENGEKPYSQFRKELTLDFLLAIHLYKGDFYAA